MLPPFVSTIAAFEKPTTDNPSIVLPPAAMTRPLFPDPVRPAPLISIRGVPAYPGSDSPSITTGLMKAGSDVLNVIVAGPVPGMSKSIVADPVLELAWRTAHRSEWGLVSSLVLVTISADRSWRRLHHLTAQPARRPTFPAPSPS